MEFELELKGPFWVEISSNALSRNAKLNFTATVSTYKIDLEEQLEAGIEQDENY